MIGHIDEIGVHVTHIDDEGYLRFGEVGGWDPIQLVGQRVRLATRGGDVVGVIGRKPIHLIKSDERDRAPKTKDLHIDIGAADGDEAETMVRIGDVGVIDVEPVTLPNDRLVSRSLDNRIGCFVAAEAARLVAADGGAAGDVLALAVAQEETTFAGARTSAFGLDPDLAIVVDVTHATDQPGVELGPDDGAQARLGSGDRPRHDAAPARHRPAATRPPRRRSCPFTVESLGRGTGTDADAVHATRAGIPTGAGLGAAALHALLGRARVAG